MRFHIIQKIQESITREGAQLAAVQVDDHLKYPWLGGLARRL